jgi:hypothetical protein
VVATHNPTIRAASYGQTVANVVERAVSELREAILAARESDEWFGENRIIYDVVQRDIARWADDLGRSLRIIDEVLGATNNHSGEPDETMRDLLESAFVHVVSARDKLLAIAVQILGIPSLWPYKKSVCFEPDETALKRELSALREHRQAGQVKDRLDELAGHPAIKLRNQIIHALSPIGGVAPNCWIHTAHLDDKGGVLSWRPGPLYPEHTLEQGDLGPETIWRWATALVAEARELLLEATTELASLIGSIGTLAMPQPVYRWPDGRVQLTCPMSE